MLQQLLTAPLLMMSMTLISRKLKLMIIKMKMRPSKMKSGSVHQLTHDGVTNLSNSVQWLVNSLFSQVKERMSAHLSDAQDIDKETLLKMCEPGDIFSGLNT